MLQSCGVDCAPLLAIPLLALLAALAPLNRRASFETRYSPAPIIFTGCTGFSFTMSYFWMILNARMPEITRPKTTYLVSRKLRGVAVVT